MLRIISLVAVSILLLAGVASAAAPTSWVALSSTTYSSPSNGQIGLSYKPSNNVVLLYGPDLALKAQNYSLLSKHNSGNRTYSTSNLSTAIVFTEDATVKEGVVLTSGASFVGAINAGESAYDTATWTGM